MALSCGIVGLPNVGKSTIFNALTRSTALAASYAYATIEPNVGEVQLPDYRLKVLAEIVRSGRIVHATTRFVDIAGLPQGASTGAGLGNAFLSHIRETDALAMVLRCYEDGEAEHVEGGVDPVRDAEIVDIEMALADLAFDGWNYREALQYGQRALSAGAERAPTQLLLARAHAGLGEADQAVAAAGAARSAAPKDQSFAAADVLILLGREREARMALESLRDTTALRPQAERRLGLLAFDRGDYGEAQNVFSALLKDPESSGIAVYYLAAIAERRGETASALRGYQMLSGTGLEAAARSRAATILYKEGQRDDALALLQPKDDATPATRLEAEIAQAQLLSNGGEGEQALARVEDVLARFPGHPDVLYQKAILLEKAGRTDAAIAQLETLYRDRPQDSAISNALGFILADHNRELSRAQRLINSALKSEPDNPAILDSLGWLQYRRGMLQAALPLLERAFRLDQDGDIGAHWGEVLWALGDKVKARETWNRALMVDPDNALVKAAQRRAGVPSLPVQGTGTSI